MSAAKDPAAHKEAIKNAIKTIRAEGVREGRLQIIKALSEWLNEWVKRIDEEGRS